MGYGANLIYKIERGARIPRPEFLDKADEVLGAGGKIAVMKADVERARYPKKVRDLAKLESQAVEIGAYANIVAHGLLQTEEYACALYGLRRPAFPEVVRSLDSPYPHDALRALGRTGPPAGVVADRLAAYGGTHQRMAAWAHWRVTGDPTLALDVCGAAVRSGTASHGLPFLADLGPLAAAHAGPVRRLMGSPGAWTRTYAAYAYWRITGDPDPAVPVLLAEVDPAWSGRPDLPVQEAVSRLGEIGAPAAEAAPLLRRILAQEERLSRPFERVRILADQAYVRTLTEALERIDRWGK